MYLVIALTVLDLIAAVGVGVFIANILTIDKMSALQSKSVKSISTGDGDLEISDEERQLLDAARGQILLFQLNGDDLRGCQGHRPRAQRYRRLPRCGSTSPRSPTSGSPPPWRWRTRRGSHREGPRGLCGRGHGHHQTPPREAGALQQIAPERTGLDRRLALQQAVSAIA